MKKSIFSVFATLFAVVMITLNVNAFTPTDSAIAQGQSFKHITVNYPVTTLTTQDRYACGSGAKLKDPALTGVKTDMATVTIDMPNTDGGKANQQQQQVIIVGGTGMFGNDALWWILGIIAVIALIAIIAWIANNGRGRRGYNIFDAAHLARTAGAGSSFYQEDFPGGGQLLHVHVGHSPQGPEQPQPQPQPGQPQQPRSRWNPFRSRPAAQQPAQQPASRSRSRAKAKPAAKKSGSKK